jgi:hypothetical protein
MNTRITQIIVLIAFAITVLTVFKNVANFYEGQVTRWEFYLSWLTRCAGAFIAIVASFVLLLRGIGGASLEQQTALILPVLAGIVLITPHWAAVAALGLIVLAIAAIQIIRILGRPSTKSDS